MRHEHRIEMNPGSIQPSMERCIVKREPAPDATSGGIIIPEKAKNHARVRGCWGEIAALPDVVHDEYGDLKIGDHIAFSESVAEDDTWFFTWKGEDYMLMPLDAVQLRRPS